MTIARTHFVPENAEKYRVCRRPAARVLGAAFTSLLAAAPLVMGACALGCSSEPTANMVSTGAGEFELTQDSVPGTLIRPGRSVGPVRLGATYGSLKSTLDPTGTAPAFGANNVVFASYPSLGLEIVFASTAPAALTDDARVLSVGALNATPAGIPFVGIAAPGERRDVIEQRLGKGENTGDTVFYSAGLGIRYASADAADAVAKTVSVFPAYRIQTRVPEMRGPVATSPSFPRRSEPLDLGVRGTKGAKSLGVVDMHLHPGFFGRIPATTKPFIVNSVPPFLKVHVPAVSAQGLDPWAPELGIRAQTELAGVGHAVLFAVYTQKTTGYMTNEEVEAIVTDARNRAADGLPWAFALASINFFDGYVKEDGTVDEAVARRRLAALSEYFEQRRDVFVGIKLAHAHQGVAFDDARYLGVYDVAAKSQVPVYLHTGFTPFPGGKNLPAYYDPQGLENTIINFPNVTFVLGHVGQGDPTAVEHCLQLATKYPNVFLEISALNRPLVVDDDGDAIPPDPSKPQYPYVIAQVKARGLIDKTIFGTDGPQSAGTVKKYSGLLRQAMTDNAYTPEETAAVMGGNFQRVYFPSR